MKGGNKMQSEYKLISGVLYTNNGFTDRTKFVPCRCGQRAQDRILSNEGSLSYYGKDNYIYCNSLCAMFELYEQGGKQYARMRCGGYTLYEIIEIIE